MLQDMIIQHLIFAQIILRAYYYWSLGEDITIFRGSSADSNN